MAALLIWSRAWLTESLLSANFGGAGGGFGVRWERCKGEILSVVNGEEELPAVGLALLVTLEELGVLSSDLLIFWCFRVLWGFVFPFVSLLGCCRVG